MRVRQRVYFLYVGYTCYCTGMYACVCVYYATCICVCYNCVCGCVYVRAFIVMVMCAFVCAVVYSVVCGFACMSMYMVDVILSYACCVCMFVCIFTHMLVYVFACLCVRICMRSRVCVAWLIYVMFTIVIGCFFVCLLGCVFTRVLVCLFGRVGMCVCGSLRIYMFTYDIGRMDVFMLFALLFVYLSDGFPG